MIDSIKIHFLAQNVNYLKFSTLQGLTLGVPSFVIHKHKFSVGSFDYNINISIIDNLCRIEFSIPKFLRGYNVNDDDIIETHLIQCLTKLFDILNNNYMDCPPILDWVIDRLDFSINFITDNPQLLMRKLQYIEVARKDRYIYETSVMYVGTSYSLKFYLKGAEFKAHDFTRISHTNANLAYELLKDAEKVIRFEITMRKPALKEYFNCKDLTVNQYLKLPFGNDKLNTVITNSLNIIENIQMDNTNLRERLIIKYGKNKGNRLYYFKIAMSNPLQRKLLTSSISRTTIYRNNKLISAIYEIPN